MKNFMLQIMTPGSEFYNDNVLSVSLDTIAGRIQILAGHIPYISGVLPSKIKINTENGERYGIISEGFLSFSENNALLFTDTAEWADDNREP